MKEKNTNILGHFVSEHVDNVSYVTSMWFFLNEDLH